MKTIKDILLWIWRLIVSIFTFPAPGGSSGGGSSPITTNLLTRTPETITGTWTRSQPGVDLPYRFFYSNITNADGDGFKLNFWIPAGTYSIVFNSIKNSDRPKVDVKLDGSLIQNVDLYNATVDVTFVTTITGVVVVTSGLHTVEFYANTKNASSSGYTHSYADIELLRTA